MLHCAEAGDLERCACLLLHQRRRDHFLGADEAFYVVGRSDRVLNCPLAWFHGIPTRPVYLSSSAAPLGFSYKSVPVLLATEGKHRCLIASASERTAYRPSMPMDKRMQEYGTTDGCHVDRLYVFSPKNSQADSYIGALRLTIIEQDRTGSHLPDVDLLFRYDRLIGETAVIGLAMSKGEDLAAYCSGHAGNLEMPPLILKRVEGKPCAYLDLG
jgi:hypothetical protein